ALYPRSLHDALPILAVDLGLVLVDTLSGRRQLAEQTEIRGVHADQFVDEGHAQQQHAVAAQDQETALLADIELVEEIDDAAHREDRKSTRLNSSHVK